MATIDNLDISIYMRYAQRTQYVEEIREQFQLDRAAQVAKQAVTADLSPKLTELDILLGISKSYTPWALFREPKSFRETRRSPFSRSRIVPSIGSEDEEEEEKKLDEIAVQNAKERRERDTLKRCVKQMKTINEWLGHIMGRIGQLIQG